MPTKAQVLDALREFDAVGEAAFLKEYANGFGSRNTWIVHSGQSYPIKAVWAAAHKPSVATTTFTTHEAKRPLRSMGFIVVDEETDHPKLGPSVKARTGPSFSEFCASVGFPLKNVRWSWCAANENDESALFTIWDNEIRPDGHSYLFWDGNADERRTDHGSREFKRMLNHAIEKKLIVYGVKCTPKYPLTVPRTRASFDRDRLFVVHLRRDGSDIWGAIVGTVQSEAVRSGYTRAGSAIDDLEPDDIGNASPERMAYTGTFIVRDDRVRQQVLKRASGRCEHCGQKGFEKSDGSAYVEAHHIISLARQGPDTLDNVIALCPNHHREAHFGVRRIELEAQLLVRLAELRGRRHDGV